MANSKKITWEALDHIKEENSSDWFWIVGIIATGVAVLSIYFGNILFAILVLIATFAIFTQSHREPNMVNFEVNRQGVVVKNTLYPYVTLESYNVIDEDGWDRDRILLKSKKLFMPMIVIPLGEFVDVDEVREYLLEYLDEEALEESVFEKIMIIFGF